MAETVKKKVSIIPIAMQADRYGLPAEKKKRVAAYCRVSTELEQQETSYEAQVEYYTSKIKGNDNWEFAGIYADDGKSATNTKKRDDFRAMIQDALDGKIDLIITKSVSRFARNTVDSLTTIRKLKEKNVGVEFEKEAVNTLESTGEFLITILSSIAQEESRNISENTRWGIVRRFERGQIMVNHSKFMGYTKNEQGELVIVPEEAEIVKTVFRMYLEGNSSNRIAKYLESKKIKTATKQERWHSTVIDKMLKNEKYMGDALLQKTYTVDFMTKKKVINKGMVQQYYVEDDHEPIIPKDLFYMVQEERARRASLCKAAVTRKSRQKKKFSSLYALSGMVVCGECGHEYRRVTWTSHSRKRIVWRCTERLANGTKNCKSSPTIMENDLQTAVMEALHRIVQDDGEFVDAFRQNVIRVLGSHGSKKENSEFDDKISEKQNEMLKLIEENAKQGSYNDKFDAKYRKIADEIETLKNEKLEHQKKKRLAENYESRVRELDKFIDSQTLHLPEFDNDLVRRLVSGVKVITENRIQIQFKSGILMEQALTNE